MLRFKYSSDLPKWMCFPALPTSMIKTGSSSDSTTSAAQMEVDYNGVDDGATSSILKASSSTDSSTSAAQIEVEFDEVGAGGITSGKTVKKLSKVIKLSKSPKSLKGPKNLQKPLVRRNVYQSTGPLSTKNSSFC